MEVFSEISGHDIYYIASIIAIIFTIDHFTQTETSTLSEATLSGAGRDQLKFHRALLAVHYGFTAEELEFIVDYDINYRLGRAGDKEAE